MSFATVQPTSTTTSSLGQSTKGTGHTDTTPYGGGFAPLFARRRHGDRVHFRTCNDHPAYADLQAVFAKTVGSAAAPRGPLLPDSVTTADA